MARRSPALRVGTPCPVAWADMPGDDRVRFCGQCQQNVYNVASLTAGEVRELVQRREGRVCVRLQHRADGTVITRDCWHAFRRARDRVMATALGVVAATVGFWGGVAGLRRAFQRFTDGPGACPPPGLAAREEPPELEIPAWLAPGYEERQGPVSPRPRKRRRPRVQPPAREADVTMGDMLIVDPNHLD